MNLQPVLRDALRPLLRRKGVTSIILITLALGVGVNLAIFSVFQQVLLQKLPIPEPDQIHALSSPGPKQGMTSSSGTGRQEMIFSHAMWRDLSSIDAPHQGIAGFRNFGANLAFRGDTKSASGVLVTDNYFDVLDLKPAAGRLYRTNEFASPGDGGAAVLSHAYWRQNFGSDPDVIGQTLVVNGKSFEIIGVAPSGFVGLNRFSPADVFLPLTRVADLGGWEITPRNSYWMYLFTRISAQSSAVRVEQVLDRGYRRIVEEFDAPLLEGVSDDWRQRFLSRPLELVAAPAGMSNAHDMARTPLILMLGVTALVLLVACVNIANLLLAVALSDRGETAVRMALGAGRRQIIVRQLLQLGVLALIGALACIPVALLTLNLVLGILPGGFPISAGIDTQMFLAAGGISLIAVALAGMAPLLQAFGSRPIAAIREQSGRAGSSRFSSRLRSVLVAGQIALALALLTVSGLFIQSMINIARVDLGMDIEQIVQFRISPGRNGYEDQQTQTLYQQLQTRLAALPEVDSASISLVPLLSESSWGSSVSVEGFEATPDTGMSSNYNAVSEEFFSALDIPLLAGRYFSASDTAGRPKVATVNRAFAERFEMGENVIGKRMALSTGNNVELDIEVIGLIGDTRYATIKDRPPSQFFLPIWQTPIPGTATFYVRTRVPPENLMTAVRDLVADLDPNLPVDQLDTLERSSQQSVVIDRVLSTMAGLFAGLATVLAAVGLFGMLSFTIAQRSSELGLRGALGASPRGLQKMVLMHALRLGIIGGLLGIGLAAVIGRGAAGLLYGISPFSIQISLICIFILLSVIVIAGWLPARRAASIQPVEALRHE